MSDDYPDFGEEPAFPVSGEWPGLTRRELMVGLVASATLSRFEQIKFVTPPGKMQDVQAQMVDSIFELSTLILDRLEDERE